ncbi:MAG: hypothetical protein U0R72_11155 [Nakamurella multipartita]
MLATELRASGQFVQGIQACRGADPSEAADAVVDKRSCSVTSRLAAWLQPAAARASVPAVIAVDRAGYTGQVDVAAIGSMIIETRGATVVGLS